MSKLKTSISLDDGLLEALDRQAKADGISRSELIERFCRQGLQEDDKVEFFRMQVLPSQVVPVLQTMQWHDEDGLIEVAIRVPAADWDDWKQRQKSRASRAAKKHTPNKEDA